MVLLPVMVLSLATHQASGGEMVLHIVMELTDLQAGDNLLPLIPVIITPLIKGLEEAGEEEEEDTQMEEEEEEEGHQAPVGQTPLVLMTQMNSSTT